VVAVEAVTGKSGLSDFEALAELHEISGVAYPKAVDGLETAPVLHKTVVAAADMQAAVENYLGV
jgi:threonine synthase